MLHSVSQIHLIIKSLILPKFRAKYMDIKVKGVIQEVITLHKVAIVRFNIEEKSFQQIFRLVQYFPCKMIIGNDLVMHHQTEFIYGSRTITLFRFGKPPDIFFHMANHKLCCVLQSRMEPKFVTSRRMFLPSKSKIVGLKN